MATADQVKKLYAMLDSVMETPIEDLIEKQAWGSINFARARPALETIFSIASSLKNLPVEIVPEGTVQTFQQVATQADAAVQSIREFNLEVSNPGGQRDSIVSQVQSASDQMLAVMQSWIPFLAYQRGDVQRNIEALNDAVGKAKGLLVDATGTIGDRKKQVDGIVSAAQEAAAKVGVAHFTQDFSGQAEDFKKEAKLWLGWTAGLAVVSVVAAFVFLFLPLPSGASTAQLAQYMTSKLVLLGVLITATVWCGRIYRGTRHNEALNRHRSNALKSFQAFVKATDDEQTKNAVLLETTRAIFAIAPSGFLDSGDSSSDSSSKVLEIVKNSSKS